MKWEEMVLLPEEVLGSLDIAEMNLACAAGLPGSEKIDPPRCLHTLDRWAEAIRTKVHRSAFERRPGHWDHSWERFQIHGMITILQREFGLRYNPAKIPDDAPFETDDMFIHGAIQGEGGTCGTLPVVYAAVGRRLGHPLRLVSARANGYGHCFVRWDEFGKVRFNIEVNNHSMDCPPDEYYRTGVYQTRPDWELSGSILKSLSPREELAVFLAQRADCWATAGSRRMEAEMLSWAVAMVPHNLLHKHFLKLRLDEWNFELERSKPPGFPSVYINFGPRRFPATLDLSFERNLIGLSVTEFLLKDPANDRRWWGPMRCGAPLPKRLANIFVQCTSQGYRIHEEYATP